MKYKALLRKKFCYDKGSEKLKNEIDLTIRRLEKKLGDLEKIPNEEKRKILLDFDHLMFTYPYYELEDMSEKERKKYKVYRKGMFED